MTRPSHAQIDLTAIRHNFALARQLGHGQKTLAVIKANAYGHGALQVAQTLEPLTDAFAVACCEEALALREAGIQKPFLLLEGFFDPAELAICCEHDFWLLLENLNQVNTLVTATLPSPLTVWLKVDTGMHRLGLDTASFANAYGLLKSNANVTNNIVAATHFACADELDNPFTDIQIERLKSLCSEQDIPLSLANSPALLGWPQSRAAWNRPGFMLYGNTPFEIPHSEADKLLPAMTMASQVMSLRKIETGEGVGYGTTWRARRPSVIATIPIGYGDGYPRNAPSGTPVLVKGQRAPLAGRVSMDLITVDVTDIEEVAVGDRVECWGSNLSVNDIARAANTSAYELLTRIPARLPRVYINS